MKYYPTGEEAAALDKFAQDEEEIPGIVLMERAALAASEVLRRETEPGGVLGGFSRDRDRIGIVAESGNNGGDGLALARILRESGYRVAVCLLDGIPKETESFRIQKKILQNLGVSVSFGNPAGADNPEEPEFSDLCSVLVDAIFGVGLHRPVTGKQAEAVRWMNRQKETGTRIVSLDVPTGISSDTGEKLGEAVQADLTITFQYVKYGLLTGEGRRHAGKIIRVPMGLPSGRDIEKHHLSVLHQEPESQDLAGFFPVRKPDANKGTCGRVFLAAGSRNIGGAACFSAAASCAAGAGLTEVCTETINRSFLNERIPEALTNLYEEETFGIKEEEQIQAAVQRADAVAAGPGLGTGDVSKRILLTILKGKPDNLVLDADALNLIGKSEAVRREAAGWKDLAKANLILTPHPMEMIRLEEAFGRKESVAELLHHPEESALRLSELTGATVILKNARTIIADRRAHVIYVNTTGNAGMAKGGSGDVLTGILAALLAENHRRKPDFSAEYRMKTALLAVRLHGLSGDAAAGKKGLYGMTASDIIREIPCVMQKEGSHYGNRIPQSGSGY